MVGERQRLTPRQRQVLALYANGLTNKDCAALMGLSVQTVKNHALTAYRTLEVQDRYQAFVRLGWLHPPEMRDGKPTPG